MKKLGIAIKSTLMGSGEPFKLNAGPWDSRVVDIRDVLRHVPSVAANPNKSILFLSFSEAGTYITMARTYPNRPGDNVAGWIFVPNDIVVSGEEMAGMVTDLTDLIFKAELPSREEMERLFGKAYPLKPFPMKFKPSPKNGRFAKRDVTPEFPLPLLIGPEAYQPYYSEFQAVFIERSPGDVVDATDLTARRMVSFITILPPDPDTLHGAEVFFAHNGQPFLRPESVPLGSTIPLVFKKPGFEPKKLQVRADADGARVAIPNIDWQRKITPADFRILNSFGARISSGVRIAINGEPLEAFRFMSEKELSRARVTVRYQGVQKTTDVDLRRLPVTITLDEAPAGAGYAAGADRRGADEPTRTSGRSSSKPAARNRWVDRAIGFCAGILLCGIAVGILAICGVFSHKEPKTTDPVTTTAEVADNPTPKTAPGDEQKQDMAEERSVEEAVGYLENNSTWSRAEMEQFPQLRGLFDKLAAFDFSDLTSDYNEVYISSERLKKIKQHGDDGSKYWDPREGKDTGIIGETISYQLYINNLDPGRGKAREQSEGKQSSGKNKPTNTGSQNSKKHTSSQPSGNGNSSGNTSSQPSTPNRGKVK